MGDFPKSAMIALLPTTSDWCKIDLPHLTLVYCGEIEDLKPSMHNEMAKTALDLAMTCSCLTLPVKGIDVFGGGEEEEVEVLKLKTNPQLEAMRSVVEKWNASKHPFNPHATVGPIGSIGSSIPNELKFDRVAVGWGDKLTSYKMV